MGRSRNRRCRLRRDASHGASRDHGANRVHDASHDHGANHGHDHDHDANRVHGPDHGLCPGHDRAHLPLLLSPH